ncbi:hypothetical protein JXA32_04855 [Candidatus Sumerlaeota bacterium]|nr:hypothetical protein [Candidatus Sumerlaeota bacterium]
MTHRKMTAGWWIGAALALLLIAPAHGDRMALKNGNVLHGLTLQQEDSRVQFRVDASDLWIPRGQIASLELDDEATNALLRLEIASQRGQLDDAAVEAFQSAAQYYQPERLQRALTERAGELVDGFERADDAARQRWLGLMTGLERDQPDDPAYVCLLARLFERAELPAQARKTYLRLPEDWLGRPEQTEQRAQADEFASRDAIRTSREEDFTAAAEDLELLTLTDSKHTTGLAVFAAMAEGRAASRQGEWRRALELYEQRISKLAPELWYHRSRATLHGAEAALTAEEPDAAAQFRAAEVWRDFGAQWRERDSLDPPIETLLERAEHWMAHGELAGARACLEACDALTTRSTQRQWKMLEYYTLVSVDAGRTPDVLRELVLRMMDEKLFEQAREGCLRLRNIAGQEELTDALLRKLDQEEAQWLFQTAKQEFKYGAYHRTLDLLAHFKRQFPDSGLSDPAEQLERQTREAMIQPPEGTQPENPGDEAWNDLERLYLARGMHDRLDETDPRQHDDMPLTWREVEKIRENPERYVELRSARRNDWQRAYRAEQLYLEARRLWREGHYSEASRAGFEIVNQLSGSIYAELWLELQDALHIEWKVELMLDGQSEPFVLQTYHLSSQELERELKTINDAL